MTEQASREDRSVPIRGAIRTIIRNSTDIIEAGGEFSIFVTIQNPFEVPLTLHQISTHIPTEFIDLDQENRFRQIANLQKELGELQDLGRSMGITVPSGASLAPKKAGLNLRSIRLSLPFMAVEYGPHIGASIARDISSDQVVTSATLRLPFIGSAQIKRTIEKNDSQQSAVKEQLEQDIDTYVSAIDALREVEPVLRDLQPGNSTTRLFTLRTRKKIWFKPSTYRLEIEIEYEINGTRNFDTINHEIQVKASLTSVVLGSLFGASGGWVVREVGSGTPDISALLRLLVSVVLAAMAVVLFARKKDVQPLIAIEDFWGGVAIGFLAAYVGPKIIQDILPTGAGGTPKVLLTPGIG